MRPFWLQQALESPEESRAKYREAPPLTGRHRVDVCIVGGGYTGLWTAIMLRQQSP